MHFLDLVFASLFVNHLVFFHFFGLSEVLAESRPKNLLFRTVALTAVLCVATLLFWLPDQFLLRPFHAEFARSFLLLGILWVTTSLWAVLPKPTSWPSAKELLAHSLLLGGILLIGSSNSSVLDVLTVALAVGLGYGGTIALLGAVDSRLARESIPVVIQGLPLQLMTLGMVWLVLQGLGFAFSGNGA